MNGLDDLRGIVYSRNNQEQHLMHASVWTLRNAIQPHIDIYLSQATLVEVQRSFPYMVSKEFASGGGDVRTNSLYKRRHSDLLKIYNRSQKSDGIS